MKLLIVVNDSFVAAMHHEYTGAPRAVNRRIIEMQIPDEIAQSLVLEQIGTDRGQPVYESIESVTIDTPFLGGKAAKEGR